MKENYSIPVPLSEAIKTYTDQELIETISMYLTRLEKSKYSVNAAGLAMLDIAQTEWVVRHGNAPVPKIIPEAIFIFEGEIYDPFPY
ncbi:TPA: hypothetical protein HA278_03860 [Candidatus Woesearchaeota archaeon]|nr:hypothetical protein [Candidatus Woesearchaeota archaeon]|tara:strand:- start:802 stop:1062 length:261 start_codon:yes stop_codon:yes gene_type:complete